MARVKKAPIHALLYEATDWEKYNEVEIFIEEELAKYQIPVPQKPEWNLPSLPQFISKLSNDELTNYQNQFAAWQAFIIDKRQLARMQANTLAAKLKYMEHSLKLGCAGIPIAQQMDVIKTDSRYVDIEIEYLKQRGIAERLDASLELIEKQKGPVDQLVRRRLYGMRESFHREEKKLP